MRELCELSIREREKLVDRVSEVMKDEFQISKNSTDIFWGMFVTGQKMYAAA